jgi:hypothetical protein
MTTISAFRLAPLLAVPVLALLASCGADKIVPPCPPVRIDAATASLTRFKEGAPADMNNVVFRADVIGYKGECKFSDNKVDVVMDIDFALSPGPAAKGDADFYYFVAIPQFFPKPEGKSIIELKHHLGNKAERVRETNVHAIIPLKKDEPAAAYDVYIGLQLTPAELAYNSAHPTR